MVCMQNYLHWFRILSTNDTSSSSSNVSSFHLCCRNSEPLLSTQLQNVCHLDKYLFIYTKRRRYICWMVPDCEAAAFNLFNSIFSLFSSVTCFCARDSFCLGML